jgi:hypothetical protein
MVVLTMKRTLSSSSFSDKPGALVRLDLGPAAPPIPLTFLLGATPAANDWNPIAAPLNTDTRGTLEWRGRVAFGRIEARGLGRSDGREREGPEPVPDVEMGWRTAGASFAGGG